MRHGRPSGIRSRGVRPRRCHWLRLRHGGRAPGDGPARDLRHPQLHRERPAVPQAVRMKVSLNWLSEYIDLPTRDPGELRRVLETVGHEVEDVERLAVDWTGVVIARVETVSPHPDADKVRVCTVTAGGDPITVVCGAWNFEAGAIVAFATPGAILPGDFHIGVRTIRGVESLSLICSERELDLGEDAAGILVLDPDAPVGKPLESILALPDVVFDLDITPNRPDAMSMVGIARDLAAWFDTSMKVPSPLPATTPGNPGIRVTIKDPVG